MGASFQERGGPSQLTDRDPGRRPGRTSLAKDFRPPKKVFPRSGSDARRCRGFDSVGARGFEPPTSCSQSTRATRLRHAPFLCSRSLHDQRACQSAHLDVVGQARLVAAAIAAEQHRRQHPQRRAQLRREQPRGGDRRRRAARPRRLVGGSGDQRPGPAARAAPPSPRASCRGRPGCWPGGPPRRSRRRGRPACRPGPIDWASAPVQTWPRPISSTFATVRPRDARPFATVSMN